MNITIKDRVYRTGKLNAFDQWAIARRLGAVFSQSLDPVTIHKLMTFAKSFRPEPGTKAPAIRLGDEVNIDAIADAVSTVLPFVSKTIGSLSDEDSKFIFTTCLSVCQVQESQTAWAALATDGELMYTDLSLATMLRLSVEVIRENLTDFFSELPSLLKAGGTA